MPTTDLRLLMIGAMYENGGNTAHRLLDGHPEMFVYPFESQLGTRFVVDQLTSMFPVKYRWPVFSSSATPEEDYAAIIDEECKVRARTPQVSKFRDRPFDFSDDERRELFVRYVSRSERTRSGNVAAFFRATFDAWRDYRRSGREQWYVGYSPIIVVDAAKILEELRDAHFVHVVRNPWSAYADTKKRPVPLSLPDYTLGWSLNQHLALLHRQLYPDRFHLVRTEDVMADPMQTLGDLCERLGLERADSLRTPTWNGDSLEEVYPWGTIRHVDPEVNRATAEELSPAEREQVRTHAGRYLEILGYDEFLAGELAGVR